jgi:hypothetical protein
MLLRDPNNCLYPLVKDNVGGIQNPIWTNLSAINCIATGRKRGTSATTATTTAVRKLGKTKAPLALTVLVMENNPVLQAILSTDVDALKKLLVMASEDEGISLFISEFRRLQN